MLTRATGQKMQTGKIQDGGRPPFWKSPYIREKSPDFDKIWYTSYIEPGYSHVTKNCNF